MPQVTLLKAAALADRPQRDLSAMAVARVLADQPDEPALVLDFARGGYGDGGRQGIDRIGALADVVTFTRASTATYWAIDGKLKTAVSDAPRFEYDRITGASLGLRVEASSTNLLLHSADISNAVWIGTANFTLTPVLSVIEGQTAHRVQNAGTLASRSIRQTAGVAVGGGETASWLYETGTAANALFGIRDETANAWLYSVTVDLATLSITPFTGTGRARVIDRGVGPNGGRLLEIHVTASAIAGNVTAAWVYPTGTPINTDTAILHHAQHERLPSATSPIVTTASAVTRAADAARYAGNVPALGLAEGFTVVAVGQSPANTSFDGAAVLVGLGTSTERATVSARDFFLDGTHDPFLQGQVGSQSGVFNTPVSLSDPLTFGLSVDAAGATGALGGAVIYTDLTAGTVPTIDRVDIGAFSGGTTRKWGGTISRVVIWPRRLSDAQLQELTA